ncbi:hypothetical protein [Paenibacillus sp. MBLB4367]|uniref:hypothetical protein n=1 Tax=Paenibacillus sp. MBLB4367 TaxID=3384767 RepID=UPI003907E8FE
MSLQEYLVQGIGVLRSEVRRDFPLYRIDEVSDGRDEYDALNRLVKRYVKQYHVSEDDFYVEVRLRPTGRSGSTLFFPEQKNEHANNKGLLSRFWIRFSLSETEEELKGYGEHFNQFVQEKQFSDGSLARMRARYANHLHHIRTGKVVPESFQLKAGTGSPEEVASFCGVQAARFLRSFGYRVFKNVKGYTVESLGCQNRFFHEGKSQLLSAVELVMYWQWVTGIRNVNVDDVLYDMGYVMDNREEEYERILKGKGIAAYVVKDDAGAPSICVVKEQYEEAYGILSGMHARLVDDYTDPDVISRSRDGFDDNYYHNLNNMMEK